MRILQPYDLDTISTVQLLEQGKILPVQGNKVWSCSLFPLSKDVATINVIDKDHQFTLIDDELFSNFTVLDKVQQIVDINNGTGKKMIKTTEFGDFDDSIKRYNQLDKPIDYNEDAATFLNLPITDPTLKSQLDVKLENNEFNPQNLDEFAPKKRLGLFDTVINHPHISYPESKMTPFKSNDKKIIIEVLKWGYSKGIKYIYCINEYRPYIVNQSYVAPFVYYTIRGSL